MELLAAIFEKTGFSKLSEQTPYGVSCKLFYIPNPDGTPRWVWPVENKHPLFLKFYTVSNKRSWLFATMIRLVFFLRLQRWVFNQTEIKLAYDAFPLFSLNEPWALFTGTVGPNRKAVFYAGKQFIKVPLGKDSGALLLNEACTLNKLTLASSEVSLSFSFPQRFITKTQAIKLSDIAGEGKRCSSFTSAHVTALKDIRNFSGNARPLKHIGTWINAKNDLADLCHSDDKRLPKGMLRKLTRLIEETNEETVIETSMSHGDFTPWNMYKNGDRLHIYDWELANTMMPVGFDAFHFIIQQGVLVDHLNWTAIENKIRSTLTEEIFASLSSSGKAKMDDYLKLYLIMNTIYYLKTYSRQDVWHTQVSWLLGTWNEALSTVMSKQLSSRELVLMDLFDFLTDKNYAALKFTDLLPEHVNEFSDVDLCMDRKTSNEANAYLVKHALVVRAKRSAKSFMNTTQLFFADGSLLSVDMIWTIKRKSLVIMDANTLLKNAYTNESGIKVPQLLDNVRYIGLFYVMNHAFVPSKHKAYVELLRTPENTLDGLLFAYFLGASLNTRVCIEHIVKQSRNNTGKQAWINKCNYVIDTLRDLFLSKGMIITFSGVDGAGKSTVIDKVKYIFDKKQRRKVVVIRHRPSLLPILSALTKGKEEAEKQAADTLPRLGTNNNFFSSLLRFGYYYADYFFGQFYVYFRYVMRGYVVLYDRYYFDFINDPRRSNIQLPAFITKLGYLFLMKPDMNFFLYADARLIRERKQELDSETIAQLTQRYRLLFDQLDAGHKVRRYVPVENINLNETLNTIMNRLTFKAA